MPIFVYEGLTVEGLSSGGLRFSGSAELPRDAVSALIEAIRKHRASGDVATHLARHADPNAPKTE